MHFLINPSSSNISMQILLTVHSYISHGISWENLLKEQDISSLVIISLIRVTCVCHNALIDKEKFDADHCWGLKG